MQKLITLLAIVVAGALVAVLFFWRRSQDSWDSMWSSARDSTSSWSDTASQGVGKAVNTVAAEVDRAATQGSQLAEELKGTATRAANETGKAADGVADAAGDASIAASDIAEDLKGGKT